MAKKKKDIGSGCLVLFGLPFLLAGLFVIFMGLKPVYLSQQAENWSEVTATIISTELEKHRDSDGGTTYKVIARYSYSYQARDYEGANVSFSSRADNIGSYQQDKYQELKRAKENKAEVKCYVDPGHPEDAVLDREIRTESLLFLIPFGSIFALVGAALVFGPLFMNRGNKHKKQLEEQQPNKPWLWNKDWQDGVIKASVSGKLLGSGALGFGLALFLMPFWVGLSNDKGSPFFAYAIIGLFQAVSLGALGCFIYQLMRRFKYGKTRFEMETFPAVIGGGCRGIIKIPVEVRSLEGFEIKLENIHSYTTGSGKNSRTHRKVLWQTNKTIKARRHAKDILRTELEVDFELPSGGKISESDGDTKYWQLTASAETPGVDFKTEFCIPVFVTEQSEDRPVEETARPEISLSEVDLKKALIKHRMILQEKGDSLLLKVPGCRSLIAVFISLSCTIAFAAGIYFAFQKKEYFLTGLSGLACFISLLCLYAYALIKRETEIEVGLLSVRVSHPLGNKELHATQEEVSFMINWTCKTNGTESAWKLTAKRGHSHKLEIVKGFKDRELLDQLRKKLESSLEQGARHTGN